MERKDEILETENKRLLRTEFIVYKSKVYRNLVKKILGLEIRVWSINPLWAVASIPTDDDPPPPFLRVKHYLQLKAVQKYNEWEHEGKG